MAATPLTNYQPGDFPLFVYLLADPSPPLPFLLPFCGGKVFDRDSWKKEEEGEGGEALWDITEEKFLRINCSSKLSKREAYCRFLR